MAFNYLDFDLSIEAIETAPGRYRARVLHSPVGEASSEFVLPFSGLELENYILKMGRPRQGVRGLNSTEGKTAQDFGRKLYNAVFQDELRDCLRRSLDVAHQQAGQGLRLRLRLSAAPALADLPWEYLYDASFRRFFAHSSTTPIVRYLDLPQRIQPLAVQPPLKILVMIANPHDVGQLDIEAEWHKVQAALADLVQRSLVTLTRLEKATLSALQRQLRREHYHIFHFVGHGGFDEQTQEGVLLLEQENGLVRLVAGSYIGALLHDHPSLRLAVLNACEGARTAQSDPFAGVAQTLVQQGIPAVIAMQFEITDQAAITFAHEFYSALADRYAVDAALTEARKAIYAEGNDVEWGTPVLYLRSPDGQLFDVALVDQGQPVPPQTGITEAEEKSAPLPPDSAKLSVTPATRAIPSEWVTAQQQPFAPKRRLSRWMAWLLGTMVLVAFGYMGIRLIARPERVKWGSQPPFFRNMGSTWTDDTYGIRFVYVPAGEFLMGSSEQVTAAFNDCVTFHKECLRAFFEDQAPQHKVSVAAFWIMQTEVTNRHYKQCVDAGKCTKPNNTQWDEATNSPYPVTDVDWNQASAYAAWVGGRLPTEAEWEKAARGPNGFIYPWGDQWDASRVNYCDKNCPAEWKDKENDDGYTQTAPVGDYLQGASLYGALDMAGNVWEWTGSLYKGYPYAPSDGREDLTGTGDRVMRGGAWFDSRDAVRTAFRRGRGADFRDFGIGFRVVRDTSLP